MDLGRITDLREKSDSLSTQGCHCHFAIPCLVCRQPCPPEYGSREKEVSGICAFPAGNRMHLLSTPAHGTHSTVVFSQLASARFSRKGGRRGKEERMIPHLSMHFSVPLPGAHKQWKGLEWNLFQFFAA